MNWIDVAKKVLEKDETKIKLAPLSNIVGADIHFDKGRRHGRPAVSHGQVCHSGFPHQRDSRSAVRLCRAGQPH